MTKHLSTIVFSLFLLFQTASLAEETNEDPQENMIEEAEPAPKAAEAEEEVQEKEPQEEISEAMREANAAEEAEIREAGRGEEPVPQ